MTAVIIKIEASLGDNGMGQREKTSMEKLLREIEQLPDQKMEAMFSLMPHEVGDVKDILRRSKI